MELKFRGEIWFWKGPAPFYFVTVPEDECHELRAVSRRVSYGWGVIPVTVRIGKTRWTTSLFPKDGRFLVPLKDRDRRAEAIELGDVVELRLTIDV